MFAPNVFCYSDLESPGQSLKGLLLKYSRVSGSTQGTKTYNAKLTALWIIMHFSVIIALVVAFSRKLLTKLIIIKKLQVK